MDKRQPEESVEKVNQEFYEAHYKSRKSIFTLFHAFFSYDQRSKALRNAALIKKICAHNAAVFDFGAGFGSTLLRLPKNYTFYATDISANAIGNLIYFGKKTGRAINAFPLESMEDVLKGKQFDVILLSHVLEHVSDDRMLLSGLIKYIPQGCFAINVPINEEFADPKHLRKYTPEAIKVLFDSLGMELTCLKEVDRLSHFILWFENKSRWHKLLFRPVRLFFSFMPFWFLEMIDKMLPKRFKFQQLLVSAKAASAAESR